ncbi:MAG: hypothetical protein ACI9LO_001227, partial [Planctomycetota bacterium]
RGRQCTRDGKNNHTEIIQHFNYEIQLRLLQGK